MEQMSLIEHYISDIETAVCLWRKWMLQVKARIANLNKCVFKQVTVIDLVAEDSDTTPLLD